MANPGAAYGASALGPAAGAGAGAAPGNADAVAGTELESMPSQPVEDDNAGSDSETESEHKGLALPFEPVALVFKDIHYYVKRPDNKSEELELLKVSHAANFAWLMQVLTCFCVVPRTDTSQSGA